MTKPIVSQKTSAAEAEGGLSKSFGIGRLCSASVIVCNFLYSNYPIISGVIQQLSGNKFIII
jgi:hypothetical protein